MITMKRALFAAFLIVGVLAGSYQLYAGGGPGSVSDAECCPEGPTCCEPCEPSACGS